MPDDVENLKLLIRTRHAIVTIDSLDETFVTRSVCNAAAEMGLGVMEWSASDGLKRIEPMVRETAPGTQRLSAALRFMRDSEAVTVYILKDAIRYLGDDPTARMLRETAMDFARNDRTIFMVDPGGQPPSSVHHLAVPYEMALPDEKEIESIVRRTYNELSMFGEGVVDMTRSQFSQFLTNLRGLTRTEISQVMAEAVLGDGRFDANDIAVAVEHKRKRLRQTGVLDYIPPPADPPDVGGMETLREWLARRARALTPEAKEFGLSPPRGILLLGVQGCGKSLMARHTAALWNLPLLRMDVGSLYDKYVGETERHMRTAFEVADAMAPCVLWVDEIEKAFASAGAGAAGARSDGGLSQRVFGQLLTWMQDHSEPVFLVATANDVSALPPELMRKGRFDEIFFVDLPSGEARREILRIHLSRRKRDPENFDSPAIVAASEGFSGSEIEQAIVSALYAAFADKRELSTDDLLEEFGATSPLSVVMAEKVAELRAWAHERCVPAD